MSCGAHICHGFLMGIPGFESIMEFCCHTRFPNTTAKMGLIEVILSIFDTYMGRLPSLYNGDLLSIGSLIPCQMIWWSLLKERNWWYYPINYDILTANNYIFKVFQCSDLHCFTTHHVFHKCIFLYFQTKKERKGKQYQHLSCLIVKHCYMHKGNK